MKKKNLMIIGLLAISLFAWIVVAENAIDSQIKINSPSSYSNFSNISLGLTFFNVSFTNDSFITGASAANFNVTFLLNNTILANGSINGTGKWFAVATLTRGCTQLGATARIECVANSTNVSLVLPDGTYTLNANITNATGGTGTAPYVGSVIANFSNVSSTIVLDRTPPISTTSNFSSNFYAGANLSSSNGGVFTLNLSISDLTAGINTVLVNVTNRSSGTSNATLTLTREGSTNQFISTINTSHYIDGAYNLTIIATDYSRNVNRSAVLENVIFDSTAPSVSFSCSPNPVEENDVITCSCSATDRIAGINSSYGSSGLSFTTNPSTTQTGPSFSVSCSSQDLAGNIKTVSTTYAVTSGGGGSGSSSGGSSSGGSSGGSSSGGSSGGSGLSPETSEGSQENSANEGSSAQGSGAENEGNKSSSKWIIALAVLVIAVIIVVMIAKRRNR